MKKLSKLFILTIFLSIFVSSPLFAAETLQPSGAKLIATVNIQNVVISRGGNIFKISFLLTNREGLQTGVKYGINLIKDNPTNQFIADEKIYDESLTLNPNTSIKKEITYVAPDYLSGLYKLKIVAGNSNGLPLAFINVNGNFKFTASDSPSNLGLQILPDTCTFYAKGDKNSKTYKLDQTINIKQGGEVGLTCTALNSFKTSTTVIPSYIAHVFSPFGDVVSQQGGDISPISFKAGEKKIFSVTLPKAVDPQIYNISFSLNSKENSSNSINVRYVAGGTSAKIINLSLDKDFYRMGDKAIVSTTYISRGVKSLTFGIKMSDGKGKSCANPYSNTITDFNSINVDNTISVTSSCIDPSISLSVVDEKGTVLDQKDFKIKTISNINKGITSKILIFIVSIIILIIIIYLYIKRKKNPPVVLKEGDPSKITNTISIKMILPFFILITLFGLIPTHDAKADVYGYRGGTLITQIGPFSGNSGDPYSVGGQSIVASVDGSCGSICPFANFIIGASNGNGVGTSGGTTGCSGVKCMVRALDNNLKSFFIPKAEATALLNGLPSGYTIVATLDSIGSATFSGSASFNVQSSAGSYVMNFADSGGGIIDAIGYMVVNPTPPPTSGATTVTVYANGSTPRYFAPYKNSNVPITWVPASDASSCSCSYSPVPSGYTGACGSGPAFANPSSNVGTGTPAKITSKTVFTVSCTYGPTAPSVTEISNTDTGPYGYRYQTFQIGDIIRPGDYFYLEVYSHIVSVTAVSGDTAITIATKLTTAINNTTEAQWNDALSAPASGTTGFKPSASRRTDNKVSLTLNYQNQFGGSVTPIY